MIPPVHKVRPKKASTKKERERERKKRKKERKNSFKNLMTINNNRKRLFAREQSFFFGFQTLWNSFKKRKKDLYSLFISFIISFFSFFFIYLFVFWFILSLLVSIFM
jgi:hypothetical protein